MHIGEKIKKRRIDLGYSQEKLAKELGYKSKTSIHKIEAGINDITQSKVIEFAKILKTTPAYLMDLEIENLDILLTKTELDEFSKIVSINQILFLNKIKDKKYINLFKDVLLKIFIYSKEDKKGE